MADRSFLDWPFFGDDHRRLAAALEKWCEDELGEAHGADVDAECRALVRKLGAGGWLRTSSCSCTPPQAAGTQ